MYSVCQTKQNSRNLNGDAVVIKVTQQNTTYLSHGPAKLSSIPSSFRTDLFAIPQLKPMHFSGGSGPVIERHQNYNFWNSFCSQRIFKE